MTRRGALLTAVILTAVIASCSSGGGKAARHASTTGASGPSTSSTTATTVANPESTAAYRIKTSETLTPGCGKGSTLRVTVISSNPIVANRPGSVTIVSPSYSQSKIGSFDSAGLMTVYVQWLNPDLTSPYTVTLDWAGAAHVSPLQPAEINGSWTCSR